MAEVKIRELSVGDWVRYEFPEIGKRNIQVNSIDEEDNHIGAGGVGASAWSDVSKFEPIPLTPEILEKNGFEEGLKDGEAYKIKVGFNQYLWLFNVEDGCWMFRLVLGSFEDFDIAKVEIKYVHQLQHALRLAGVDKEIEV